MNDRLKIGKLYKHFKGNIYKIIAIAQNTETDEQLVIYTDINNDKTWARPYDMFDSLVDKTVYPDVVQKYRFEEYCLEDEKKNQN